jgi:hypothetical protein
VSSSYSLSALAKTFGLTVSTITTTIAWQNGYACAAFLKRCFEQCIEADNSPQIAILNQFHLALAAYDQSGFTTIRRDEA